MTFVAEPRVRETSTTTGTDDFALAGSMLGSLRFNQVMSIGDTIDYCAQYDQTFEEGLGTMGADGKLQRTTVYRSRHGDGSTSTAKVGFAAGVKTIIGTYRANKVARVDLVQAFSSDEKAQHRANVPPFESGTRLIFQQTSAPVGWTKDATSHDNKSLRLVTGSVGSGGSVDFSVLFGRTSTDSTTPTTATMAAHNHTLNSGGVDHYHSFSAGFPTGAGGLGASGNFCYAAGSNTGGSSAYLHTHGMQNAGSGSSHSHAIDMRVKYADAIIAVAN